SESICIPAGDHGFNDLPDGRFIGVSCGSDLYHICLDARRPRHRISARSDKAPDGLDKFLRVVANTILENDLDIIYVTDLGGRVTLDDNEVGERSGAHGAATRALSEENSAVVIHDPDRSDGRKPSLNKKPYPAKVTEPRHNAAVPGRVEPGHQQAAGLDEGTLKIHRISDRFHDGRCARGSRP